jgi:glutamine synthetase|uniref:glutamine synthetase n=1 Tax=viral metagenome TaxID=1070528 RepID=A0A6C0IPM3_9ZZZZ
MTNVICEYIWLDANKNLRSKTNILLNHDPESGFPIWNYDGSSTNQANGKSSEVFIRPIKVTRDPFRREEQAFLVLCDTWIIDKVKSKEKNNIVYIPHKDNTRRQAQITFDNPTTMKEDPWFGLEQEFFFTNKGDNKQAIAMGTSSQSQEFYCGVGHDKIQYREVAEHALNNVLGSESISCTGYNWEVAPGQCEFQIFGQGIDAADSLLLFRYILNRTAEIYKYSIDYHPKPYADYNGSGCHTNYSTMSTRSEGGIDTIKSYISKLEKTHKTHIKNYGSSDNKLRLTGKNETASWEKFTYGVADRSASVRIPTKTFFEKAGYFEDRRPSSNCDPYLVITKLIETTIYDGEVFAISNEDNAIMAQSIHQNDEPNA